MKTVLVIAPHPDDETLGCGGTILRHRRAGDAVHWLIVTAMTAEAGFSAERMAAREDEIAAVAHLYGFSSVHRLSLPTTRLDTVPEGDMVGRFSQVFKDLQPDTVYVPFRGDAHSDHRVVFDAASACSKWFRSECVREVLAYETTSETNFPKEPWHGGFLPNVYVDIAPFVDDKLAAMRLYQGEMGVFPFPRSERAIRALAEMRGVESGFHAAEAFMLLRQRRPAEGDCE